ncbi:MAG: DNA-directed RNA polymerase subunit H [Candidatus Diapherotrites archaeon]|nr:DNA-directed RNA polymerase subunit H [Candidatus Diapherotrites archaeon]
MPIIGFAFAVWLIVAFRLMDNFLVPKHEIVAPQEAEELLKTWNTDRKHFPKILSDDPIVVEIEAKPGDLLRIKRFSHTAKTSVYYRVVEH